MIINMLNGYCRHICCIKSGYAFILLACVSGDALSVEWSVDSELSAEAAYTDNLIASGSASTEDFDTAIVHVRPMVALVAKSDNWETSLNAELKGNYYSEDVVDDVNQLYGLDAKYQTERNVYSMGVDYRLFSNRVTESDIFGVSNEPVKRKTLALAPSYTRLITERLSLTLGYRNSDVSSDDPSVVISSESDTFSGALGYKLTQQNQFSASYSMVDYVSDDELSEYKLHTTSIKIDHKFSKALSVDLSIGATSSESNNERTETINFFGTIITMPQVVDAEDRSMVYEVGVNAGWISGNLKRSHRSNSTGSLSQVDAAHIVLKSQFTSLLRLTVNTRYQDISAVEVATTRDREITSISPKLTFAFSRSLDAYLQYKYIKVEYDIASISGYNSSTIYVGMTYDFPSL